jgi:hypothetical protein
MEEEGAKVFAEGAAALASRKAPLALSAGSNGRLSSRTPKASITACPASRSCSVAATSESAAVGAADVIAGALFASVTNSDADAEADADVAADSPRWKNDVAVEAEREVEPS